MCLQKILLFLVLKLMSFNLIHVENCHNDLYSLKSRNTMSLDKIKFKTACYYHVLVSCVSRWSTET